MAEEASSKIEGYVDEVLNEDLTSLPADRHFDRLESEDRYYHSTIAVDTVVIGVGHHLDHYPVVVSCYY